MQMWGTYSDADGGIDLVGTRDSLRELGERLVNGDSGEIQLDHPPTDELAEGRRALDALRLLQTSDPAELIVLQRDGPVVVISSGRDHLARVVGGGLSGFADSPFRVTPASVPTHLHIEPTDGHPCSAESTVSIMFHVASGDE
jgi:hypothetical protein